jgi:DNA replication protein DnaC
MLNKLQSTTRGEDRADILDRLQRYELVVIDDLGAERSTDYALEQVYAVVDSRYRSGKPLIVTTNLAPAVIKAPANIGYQRIYDRILQNSITVKVDGVSRRTEIAEKKRNKYRAVLGL